MTNECPFDAEVILSGDPFQGDYGDGERVLKDVVGRVRKPFVCHLCAEETAAGTWARIRTEANYDGIVTYRWCVLCCQAEERANNPAVDDDDDPWESLMERERIGDENRSKGAT